MGVGVGGARSTIYVDFGIGDVMVRVPVDVEGSKARCIYAIAIVGTYDLELGKLTAFDPHTYRKSSRVLQRPVMLEILHMYIGV